MNEPVLSSAENELDIASDEYGVDSHAMPDPPGTAHAPGTGTAPWWDGVQAQVTRYVNEQPGRAALMALGAGALAALLLGRGIGGRRRKD